MAEKPDEEFLDPDRTLIRCDGSVLLQTTDSPLLDNQFDRGKADAVEYTFCYLIGMLSDHRELCRNKAQAEQRQSYESFSLHKLLSAITWFGLEYVRGTKPSYKDCMWRIVEALQVHVCYDIYWVNNLRELDRK
ncbi:hypothetical protein MPH_12959 [Macrophomina phaseolina MS6]|uniref:Uncharacterized protein n=1 Tax=Macrophomina phaseolina (strain MS6) TaxID=1126212 RepID=K2RZT7_MACPH|nr:hypothetical protein MPH_12959 [Macrophomina phaseolina MS6]